MKISFIIPAYNEEKYIQRCPESIIRETRKNSCEAEIIVVNNASTDSTKIIASGYPEVRVVDEPRKGIFYARQAGFMASSGDLIAQIDADSLLTETWINQVLDVFKNSSDIVALSGPVRFYDLSSLTNFWVNVFYAIGWLWCLINRYLFNAHIALQGSNSIIKREALARVGGYSNRPEFYGEETDLAKKLGKVGKIKVFWGLLVLTSGRRLKGEGVLRTGWRYAINHLW